MAEFIPRLAEICREHLLTEKIVVAPSLAMGHQIADAIALGGTPWVNLRFETMRTLADRVASFDISAHGMTTLSRAQALALVGRACDRALDGSSYFAALADRPGLHRAIQKTMDDLRHAAVDLSAVPATAFEDPRKALDLSRILAAYEEELITAKAVDRFGVTARAVTMLEGGAAHRGTAAIWMVLDDVELTLMEQRLLHLVAGDYELIRTARHDAAKRDEAAVDFRRALGEENEVRAAFRSILAARLPFDEAEIAYSTRDPYLPLAFELSSEYGVPCTFAEGIAAHFTRPGQACLGFLRWIGGGWHAEALQKIARSGAMKVKIAEDSALSPTGFARVLRNAAIGWGRDRYRTRIDGFIGEREAELVAEEHEGRRRAIERSLDDARHARVILQELIVMTAEVADDEHLGLGSIARAASAFVKRFAATSNQNDAMAHDAIRGMLKELAEVGDSTGAIPVSRAEWASRLTEAVKAVHVGGSNPRPGFLHVAPIRAAGWNRRTRLFVAGLDEQRHPGSGLQDPILLDAERDAVNQVIDPRSLPLLRDAPGRMTEQFRRLMARTRDRRVTLSYPVLGIGDRRDRFPSSSLLEMYRREMRPDATYAEVAEGSVRDGFVDPQPITGAEWWLMRRFTGTEVGIAGAIRDSYPGLAAGAEALAARASEAITSYDGKVNARSDLLDPRENGRVYSASGLETIARCPFQYFLKSVLHVDPLEELEFDPDAWLAANQFGLMLHEVLQQVMDELCAAGQKPAIAFLVKAEAMAEDALARWRTRVPPPGETAFERRRRELLESCEIFLRIEEETCRTFTPKYFEVSFGFGESAGDSIAMPEPLVLSLGAGRSIRVRGRIDRVDHDEARDEWHVWDYKSGGTFEYDRGGRLQRGTKLQHALYARAVEAMLERKGMTGKVTRSGYYFPTPKGKGARIDRVCSDAELKTVLNDLCDVIGNGYFLHADQERCKFCPYGEVCGGMAVAAQQAAAKMTANPADPSVKAWLDLQGAT